MSAKDVVGDMDRRRREREAQVRSAMSDSERERLIEEAARGIAGSYHSSRSPETDVILSKLADDLEANMNADRDALLASLEECLIQSPHDPLRSDARVPDGCLCRWCKARRVVARVRERA